MDYFFIYKTLPLIISSILLSKIGVMEFLRDPFEKIILLIVILTIIWSNIT